VVSRLLDIRRFVVYMSPMTLNTPEYAFSAKSVSTVRSFTVISFAISRWFVPP
jgi:hypothetical protein